MAADAAIDTGSRDVTRIYHKTPSFGGGPVIDTGSDLKNPHSGFFRDVTRIYFLLAPQGRVRNRYWFIMSTRPIQNQDRCWVRCYKFNGCRPISAILDCHAYVPNANRSYDFNRSSPRTGIAHALNIVSTWSSFQCQHILRLHAVQNRFICLQIITYLLSHGVRRNL